MRLKWIINEYEPHSAKVINDLESRHGNTCLMGRPRSNDSFSVNELEGMNVVGIYMEMLDEELRHNPNCPECKGTGLVTLFTSSSPCRCLNKCSEPKIS